MKIHEFEFIDSLLKGSSLPDNENDLKKYVERLSLHIQEAESKIRACKILLLSAVQKEIRLENERLKKYGVFS